MGTDDSFLRTKLFIPPVGPDIVIRDRLAARINEGIQRSLTFISAPAGYGKTTLLANWANGCGMPVAWVSVDEGDNEPARFLTYLVTALENALPEPGRRACRPILSVLQSPRPFSLQSVLAMLINELSTAPHKAILILDDYQFLTNQAIHDAMAFMLEHKAEGLHLIISTRSDPPLPLPRLRARRQLVEIRTADMQFTEEEAAQFLNQVMGFSLSKDDIARLENRTEGWIAGLQMAAFSLQGRLDRSRFIQGDKEEIGALQFFQ